MREAFFGAEAWGPLARGLEAFQEGDEGATLLIHTGAGEPEPLPVALFFRGRDELRPTDREALARARGRVLDGGGGVGSMALLLQERGFRVTSVEVIPQAVEIMARRGVVDPRAGRLEDLPEEGAFDTILLLMNGSALAGTLAGFPPFLEALGRLLAPEGQVLMDSTDLSENGDWEDSEAWEGDYPGELQYQLEFEGERGAPFPQLFLDPETLTAVAEGEGWKVEVVWQDGEGEYLAALTPPAPWPS